MEKPVNRTAVVFLIVAAFLNTVGIGLIAPITPSLVSNLLPPDRIGEAVGLLMGAYALCAFFAAPVFGNLSDQYGRKPLLIISLLGSAAGFFLFAFGQAYGVLLLGRIIDGVTGGNVTLLYSSLADATPREQRGKFYGFIGAATGLGFMVGPAIGGLIAGWGLRAPALLDALLTLALALAGVLLFPETLPAKRRKPLKSFQENLPWSILGEAWNFRSLRPLFVVSLLFGLGDTIFQALLPLVGYEVLAWTPNLIGWCLFFVGLVDIAIQGGLVPVGERRFGARKLSLVGLSLFIAGFGLMAWSLAFSQASLIYPGILLIALGDSLVIPTLGALISLQVSGRDMGTVQGANLSLQSFSRWLGPMSAGFAYSRIGRSIPFWGAGSLLAAALLLLVKPSAAERLHTPSASSR